MLYDLDQRIRDAALDRAGLAKDDPRRYANAVRKATTTDLTPPEIDAVGESEVVRLTTALTSLAHRAGYAGLDAYRSALAADPRYRPRSAEQIVEDFRRYVALARPRLRQIVRDPPATSLVVEAMAPNDRPAISHHINGSADGRTRARIMVAVSDYAHRSLLSDETIAFHEGLPGHELQVSMKQRARGLPAFRREAQYGAYAEGWAVYSEGLADELGRYTSDAAEYGRMNTELTRALRLVADTGMHARGWNRNRVVAYLRASGAEDEPTIQAEADRIAAWPAQGLTYKIGQLKILELRRRARAALGAAFDLRDFHQVVLSGGDLPLPVLKARVDRWIARAQRG